MASLGTNAEATVRTIFENVDSKSIDANAALMAEDLYFRFGNDVFEGRESYRQLNEEFLGSIEAIEHTILNLWAPDETTVLTNLSVKYTRFGGSSVTIPVFNIFRFREDLVAEYLIFINLAPLYEETE